MKRKFKQWCSSIPLISTKWTIISHLLNWTHWTQRKDYDIWRWKSKSCVKYWWLLPVINLYICLPGHQMADRECQLGLVGYNTKGQANLDHNGFLVWRKWLFSVTLNDALIDWLIDVSRQLEQYFSYFMHILKRVQSNLYIKCTQRNMKMKRLHSTRSRKW